MLTINPIYSYRNQSYYNFRSNNINNNVDNQKFYKSPAHISLALSTSDSSVNFGEKSVSPFLTKLKNFFTLLLTPNVTNKNISNTTYTGI